MSRFSPKLFLIACALFASAVIMLSAGCSKKSSSDSSTPPSSDGPNANPGEGAGRRPFAANDDQLAAQRKHSNNNLRQIGLAMHNYHDTYQGLPLAASCDDKGKPLLSWRVAVLPYLEQESLYRQFKLTEPWDSEHNKKLIAKMPAIYLLPGTGNASDGLTHYRVFVSIPRETPNASPLFDWPDPQFSGPLKPIRFAAVTDGLSNTIMAAEAEEAVTWTKPDELKYDPKKPVPQLGYFWKDQAQVVMGDGSTRMVKRSISETTLRSAITRNGGEILGKDW